MPRSALSMTVGRVSLISSLPQSKRGGHAAAPCSTSGVNSMRAVRHGFGAVAPDIDADKQEQPDHVHEVPVPGGEFEAEMLGRRKMPGIGSEQADQQEDGAD